jgi:DNA processing protein
MVRPVPPGGLTYHAGRREDIPPPLLTSQVTARECQNLLNLSLAKQPMSCVLEKVVCPREEMASYETLWAMEKVTLKAISDLFRQRPGLPSQLLRSLASTELFLESLHQEVCSYLARLCGFMVCVNGTFQYPRRLQDARYPIQLFYYRGYIGLAETRCVSVVGARKATPAGIKRAERLSRELAEAGFTIVSGLATGIDTAAMKAAIASKNGHTIGVIGTPLNEVYPKENAELQEEVAANHLLVSQVPFFRYARQSFPTKKYYFPERNETMAALSEATVIVEASDTSGSLTQARAALQQGRKLFILNSCFENPKITWPEYYEARGAVRVRETADIVNALGKSDGGSELAET